MSRSALVLGGQGVLGTAIAAQLATDGWQVTRAGRRPEDASDFRRLDLQDRGDLEEACAAAEVVVNTVHHRSLAPERAVLRAGGTLLDLVELGQSERSQLAEEAQGASGAVISDTGLGGVGYLALADLVRGNRQADAAEYALLFSASGSTGRAGALFAHKLLTETSHHETARVPFPAPQGERTVIEVGAGADAVLPGDVAGIPLRHYICMQPSALQRMLLALNGVRLLSRMPRASFTAGAGRDGQSLSDEPVCDWVAVSREGERIAVRTVEGRGYYRLTAAATAVFADALAARPASEGGFMPIDEAVRLEVVQSALEARGIFVQEQTAAPATAMAR